MRQPIGLTTDSAQNLMDEWQFNFAMPNIDISGKLPESQYVAIVSPKDKRIRDLCKKYPGLKNYLSRFRDTFRKKFKPSLLITKCNSPDTVVNNNYSLYGFRDCFAIATIIEGAQSLLSNQRRIGWEIGYSEYFDFYPVLLGRDNKDLLVCTPASLELDDINKFSGQSSPKLCRDKLDSSRVDKKLLDLLIQKWEELYIENKKIDENRKLFRSLAMAYSAMSLPQNNVPDLHDYGVMLGAWISAFEVIAHPGSINVNFKTVVENIDSIKWQNGKLRRKKYTITLDNRSKGTKITLASKIYEKIYDARNKFLHGNPTISRNHLVVDVKNKAKKSVNQPYLKKVPLLLYAAIIYRGVLLKYMGQDSKPIPNNLSINDMSKIVIERMEENRYEDVFENIVNLN